MEKKGSMELSVNSIVILVIAVVMMGLILGFIRSKFTDISGGFVVDEGKALEASASDPITMSKNNVPVTGTKKSGLNINFYNTEAGPLEDTYPVFECNTATVVINGEYYSKDATNSAMTEFTGNIKLQNSQAKGTYLCKVCFLLDISDVGTLCHGADIVAYKEFNLIVQ